ncbi:unnamed protein product [Lathyrus sativus]|nr:unnamed protein product [Lathyrus sativus]
MIEALDEKENLTNHWRFLFMLPVDPKLGKMIIIGAIFRCFDLILTIFGGFSVKDRFLLSQDKRDLEGTTKFRFSAKDYNDHMALVRAYEGWKMMKEKDQRMNTAGEIFSLPKLFRQFVLFGSNSASS